MLPKYVNRAVIVGPFLIVNLLIDEVRLLEKNYEPIRSIEKYSQANHHAAEFH